MIQTEQLDDVPILLAQMERMGIATLLDSHFPTHGNWSGLSLGQVAMVWLAHILSEGDHCLDHVRDWVRGKLTTLQCLVSPDLNELDFTDDRLALMLSRISAQESWTALQASLNERLIRVYELETLCVRHDSTTSSSFRLPDEEEEGLFQRGHSKDHRPDLPQVKIMLAALDPLGLPVATTVLPGNRADDPLYIPSVRQAQATLNQKGLLPVGDCKMAALSTRAFIAQNGDHDLCPLSEKQLSPEQLQEYLQPVLSGALPLQPIFRQDAEGETTLIAEGFSREHSCTAQEGQPFSWSERHLVLRSERHARSAEQALRKRLQEAQKALLSLNQHGRGKRRPRNLQTLEETVADILRRFQVASWLQVQIRQSRTTQTLRRYQDRPSRVREHWDFTLEITVREAQVQQAIRLLGWKVYATSAPAAQLSLEQAVLAYRDEYRVELDFKRLKGRLSLSPMYLQRDDRVRGLTHLLSLGLSVLTLTEFVLRRELQAQQEILTGLYPGQRTKRTDRPTTERMLRAFRGLYLTILHQPQGPLLHVTALSELQLKILRFLNLPATTYSRLADHFLKPS